MKGIFPMIVFFAPSSAVVGGATGLTIPHDPIMDTEVTELHRQAASMFFCWPTNAIDLCKNDADLLQVIEQLAVFIARWEAKGRENAKSTGQSQ